jgi:hypothetical protein
MGSTFLSLDPLAIPNSPQPEPRAIRAGDTVTWQRQVDDYPPTDPAGYMLSYTLVSRTATLQINGSMVQIGSENYEVTIPAITTAAWAPDKYRWQAYITDKAANRYTVAEGMVEVLPNLQATTGGLDERTQDEIILDNIMAMITAKSKGDVASYRVYERELRLNTWEEVLNARTIFEARVRAIRIARGEVPPKRTIGASFHNAY